MAERRQPLDNQQLERALREVGRQLAYPPTPDLARGVRARLAAGPPPRRAPWRDLLAAPWPRRLALALVLLVLLGGAVLAFSPAARRAVAGRLGIPGITIVYVTPTPMPPPTLTPLPGLPTTAAPPATPPTATTRPTPTLTATPATIGERLRLGQPVTLDEARGRVSFPVLVPALPDLGPPNEIYFGIPPALGQVSLIWLGRPDLPPAATTGVGLLLTEFRGTLNPDFVKKIPTSGTRLEALTVNGSQGYWFEGDPHQFAYQDANGNFSTENTRLAGNVLIWEQGGVTFRLEGARTRAEALRIAAAVR